VFPRLACNLIVGAAILGVGLLATPGVGVGIEKGEFDPAAWDDLLREYVRDGVVNYQGWQQSGTDELDAFLDAAGEYDLGSTMGKEPKAAFFVNAYNAWAIRQILDHYPVDSVTEIPGFFDRNARMIAGEKRTLEKIEEELATLMRQKPDFALLLVPGTSGWPTLFGRAYSTDNYIQQSDETMKEMVMQGHGYYDAETNQLHLPEGVIKYMYLYDALPNGFVSYYSYHFPLADIVAMSSNNPEEVPVPVKWELNDANPRPRPEVESEEP
jgi:hypothetical protein